MFSLSHFFPLIYFFSAKSSLASGLPGLSHALNKMAPTNCPSCGMAFASETSVLKHMNHRFLCCKFFFLREEPPPAHSPPMPPNLPLTSPDLPPPPLNPPSPNPSSSCSVDFPDAGFVYGRGDGFMGTFHNAHAEERASNIYFPFQSKGEWEIASFLSSSGLSMKHIDEFLSLSEVGSISTSFTSSH